MYVKRYLSVFVFIVLSVVLWGTDDNVEQIIFSVGHPKPLIKVFKTTSDIEIKRVICRKLGQFTSSTTAYRFLYDYAVLFGTEIDAETDMNNAGSEFVRFEAAKSIKAIAKARKLPKEELELALPSLGRAVMSDPSRLVREYIAYAIAAVGVNKYNIAAKLMRAIRKEKLYIDKDRSRGSFNAIKAMIIALRDIGAKEAEKTLIEMSASMDFPTFVRNAARDASIKLSNKK